MIVYRAEILGFEMLSDRERARALVLVYADSAYETNPDTIALARESDPMKECETRIRNAVDELTQNEITLVEVTVVFDGARDFNGPSSSGVFSAN